MPDLHATDVESRYGCIDSLEAERGSETWYLVEYVPPFPEDIDKVIVLAQCQTRRGPNTPGLRLRNVTRHTFEIRYDGIAPGSGGFHPRREDVGWVALGLRDTIEQDGKLIQEEN